MKPITDPAKVKEYGKLLREMMLTQEGREWEFSPKWVREHDWKVVPVESEWRVPADEIPRLVSVLKRAGYTHCVAVFNQPGYIQDLPVTVRSEPPSDMATCYLVSLEEADFQQFNREFGPFRCVLTTEDRFWALSSHEWYNLFAGRPEVVESILGKPLDEARRDFFEYASLLATGKNPDQSALQVAKQCEAL
jgi:hypothetical protein